jgi:glycosyltransferase involved in cell wall biosynthesis
MSIGISIIFGYRNRELWRVKNCLDSLQAQSFKDFEVVFIDYGSDHALALEIKGLVQSYSFAKYFYNHTLGMPWNRAHALNTGVRLSSHDYILFGDIDLIYTERFLEALSGHIKENYQVYSSVYFLPEKLTDLKQILSGNWKHYKYSGKTGKGGVHLIKRSTIEEIRGYDEYYAFWGVEDRDLYTRLDKLGIKSAWIDHEKTPVFHQWHTEASGANRNFFPDRWWENMNIHYQRNIENLIRNDINWGKLLGTGDRPVFNAKEIVFDYQESGNWFYKGRVAANLISMLQSLQKDECLKISIPRSGQKLSGKTRWINTVLQKLPGNLVMEKKIAERFIPEKDLIYVIWKLIKEDNFIRDYSIAQENENTIVKLMSKG